MDIDLGEAMVKEKPAVIPVLVRIDAQLKAELDRFREEDGILMSYIVNTAVREWIDRYNAPIDAARRHVEKQMAKREKERQKEEREWQRYQDRVARKIRGKRR